MKVAVFIVAGLIGITAIGIFQAKSNNTNSAQIEVATSSSTQSTAIQLVDVRTPEEYAESHLEGAKNIELSRLANVSGDQLNKEKTVQVYCRSGSRSSQAAKILKDAGYKVEDLGSLESAASKTKRNIL